MAAAERKAGRWERWLERLHNPFRLRLGMTVLALAIGYVAIYWPLSNRIEASDDRRAHDEQRLALARRIEELRAQYQQVANRLPAGADTQELVNYLLGGVRGRPVRLAQLKPVATGTLGPYRTVTLSLDLEGSFQDLCDFLRWLETNQRLLRVDGMHLAPAKNGVLSMQLTVVGLTS
ncbi:MAG TPA: type 4a pilus biogenesis protein PilO [Gemmataceae bacterium]|nr:type 4a pilus biogenesis protein PilO [Gemmataceae bacterium]